MKRKAPVGEGDVVEIKLTGTSHKGEGIGRYEGFTLFVPYGLPGEKVRCQVSDIKKGFAEAQLLEVLEAGEWRQQPACPDFYHCGGSHLQHMSYEGQLEVKQQVVKDALGRIGRVKSPKVLPVLGMKEPWAYRNKATFQVVEDEGRIRLGFFEEDSHEVTVSYDCMLLHPQIRDTAGMVQSLINNYKMPVFDWDSGQGVLRHVVIRRSWANNQVMVIFVTTSQSFNHLHRIAKELVKSPAIVGVVKNINDSPGRAIFGNANLVLAGKSSIEDKLCGLNFHISPTSFYQVNPMQTEVLYERVREYAIITGEERVLDLYCGIGTISLYLSQWVRRVIGLEVNEAATDDAAANARANGISNVEFIVGRAEDRLPKLVNQGIKADVVVVDPPRKGVDKRALVAIADMGPERIVYVSCDPASQARDVDYLRHRGYEFVEAQPVDMFPQTYHVECVVLMSRV